MLREEAAKEDGNGRDESDRCEREPRDGNACLDACDDESLLRAEEKLGAERLAVEHVELEDVSDEQTGE